ncbi:MAG: 2-phospho-L-lactate guanylyltransferase [Acidimicrobiia bacterium]|nr:2-phospho-L-lactate guanylyltransferase [Acidimicrobiia bacterium]
MEPDVNTEPRTGEPLVAIPVKGFGSAKARMAPALTAAARATLSRALASRTVEVARAAGADPVVVTAEPEVIAWAAGLGARVIAEEESLGCGLSGAAATAAQVAHRSGRPWLILHADLPLLQPAELAAAIRAAVAGSYILCPSYDGGTTGFGGRDTIEFAYGPLSFHHHLARVGEARHVVHATPGFALDVDSPADLAVAAGRPEGAWLAALIDRRS